MDYVDCTLQCSSTNCLVECGRVLNECDTSCPCELGCPNGCAGCANPICVCGDHITPPNEENLKSCVKQNSIDLGQCIIDCNENEDCEAACISNFKSQHKNCPCQVSPDFVRPEYDLLKMLRRNARLDVHVMILTVNRIKIQFWFLIPNPPISHCL